jgi:hypothetical protein
VSPVQPVSALAVVDSPVSSHLREPSPVDLLAAKVYAAIPDLSAMPAATPAQALATNTKTPGNYGHAARTHRLRSSLQHRVFWVPLSNVGDPEWQTRTRSGSLFADSSAPTKHATPLSYPAASRLGLARRRANRNLTRPAK